MPTKVKAMCCFIGTSGNDCNKEAEYDIYYGNKPDDYTQSCTSHIGELVDDDVKYFTVYRIPK